jgi:hypothetical protein
LASWFLAALKHFVTACGNIQSQHFVVACGNIQSQVMMGLLPLSLLLSVHSCDDENFNEISKQTRSAALYY